MIRHKHTKPKSHTAIPHTITTLEYRKTPRIGYIWYVHGTNVTDFIECDREVLETGHRCVKLG